MHSDPGRLVDDDQVAVFVNDGAGDELAQRLGRRLRRLCVLLAPGTLQGRQPHPIASGQPVRGLRTSAVDAHLARSQDPIDQAAGHGAEGPQEEVIETLAVIAFLRLDVADLQMRVSH